VVEVDRALSRVTVSALLPNHRRLLIEQMKTDRPPPLSPESANGPAELLDRRIKHEQTEREAISLLLQADVIRIQNTIAPPSPATNSINGGLIAPAVHHAHPLPDDLTPILSNSSVSRCSMPNARTTRSPAIALPGTDNNPPPFSAPTGLALRVVRLDHDRHQTNREQHQPAIVSFQSVYSNHASTHQRAAFHDVLTTLAMPCWTACGSLVTRDINSPARGRVKPATTVADAHHPHRKSMTERSPTPLIKYAPKK
jgi:hypothetical protein